MTLCPSRAQTGALVSRLNNDVMGAQRAFTSTLSGVVSNIIRLVLTAAVMLTLSWQITLISLTLLPVFILPARRVGHRLAAITKVVPEDNRDKAYDDAQCGKREHTQGLRLR